MAGRSLAGRRHKLNVLAIVYTLVILSFLTLFSGESTSLKLFHDIFCNKWNHNEVTITSSPEIGLRLYSSSAALYPFSTHLTPAWSNATLPKSESSTYQLLCLILYKLVLKSLPLPHFKCLPISISMSLRPYLWESLNRTFGMKGRTRPNEIHARRK